MLHISRRILAPTIVKFCDFELILFPSLSCSTLHFHVELIETMDNGRQLVLRGRYLWEIFRHGVFVVVGTALLSLDSFS